jgi:hypothetical protein
LRNSSGATLRAKRLNGEGGHAGRHGKLLRRAGVVECVGVTVGVAVGVAVGAPIGVAVAVGPVVADGVFVGTGDWASTGVGATIEWITGSSAAAMPSLRNSRRSSTLRLAGLTTSSASKCAFSSWLSVSQTSSSALGTSSSVWSVAAICCGLVCPSHCYQTRAAVGLRACTSLRCQS